MPKALPAEPVMIVSAGEISMQMMWRGARAPWPARECRLVFMCLCQ
jgi:hypothetical protein